MRLAVTLIVSRLNLAAADEPLGSCDGKACEVGAVTDVQVSLLQTTVALDSELANKKVCASDVDCTSAPNPHCDLDRNICVASCTCTYPGEGTAKNGYTCTDGTDASCQDTKECYDTGDFVQGDWESACRVPPTPSPTVSPTPSPTPSPTLVPTPAPTSCTDRYGITDSGTWTQYDGVDGMTVKCVGYQGCDDKTCCEGSESETLTASDCQDLAELHQFQFFSFLESDWGMNYCTVTPWCKEITDTVQDWKAWKRE